MASIRGIERWPFDGSAAGARAGVAHEEKRKAIRSTRLGVGTLACRRCDIPIAIGPDPRSAVDELTCPFCGTRGPVRDFLSLASPTRPARVVVRVRPRASRRVR
ncbi:MAG: hypothetical protein JOZ98_00410 [Solirubrobacterales bacterium]|nr:hypothetical protein [Solirubrobacterales bacterium]